MNLTTPEKSISEAQRLIFKDLTRMFWKLVGNDLEFITEQDYMKSNH